MNGFDAAQHRYDNAAPADDGRYTCPGCNCLYREDHDWVVCSLCRVEHCGCHDVDACKLEIVNANWEEFWGWLNAPAKKEEPARIAMQWALVFLCGVLFMYAVSLVNHISQ